VDGVERGLNRRTVFQTGLIAALLDGVYGGDYTIAELVGHGDFGLGTFSSLDGEMIIIDSLCYRMGEGGAVSIASDEELIPFAVVTHFHPDITFERPSPGLRHEVISDLVEAIPSANYLYAARIKGDFDRVSIRNVRKQETPYRPLSEVTDGEPVQHLDDVSGVMVGFQTPAYERGIGVPGGHLHFIDESRSLGGHVLDFTARKVTVEICVGTDLMIRLPTTPEFERATLDPDDLDDQVARAENHRRGGTGE
jgi:acetolactate decarboxylase